MAVFSNTATLTYNGNTAVSNTVNGEIVDVLSVEKTAVTTTYGANDTVTYIISLLNSGSAAFTDLTLSDNLGAYSYNTSTLVPLTYKTDSLKYFINGALTANPTVTSTSPLTLSGITVPAGGNALIVYEAETNGFTPRSAGGTINNTVTVSGTGIITPLTAMESVSAELSPDLTISKSLSPSSVVQNGELTYTFVIQNRGNTVAAASDNLVVSDTFNPVLCNITATLNGTALTADTDYTYSTVTGLFETVSGKITVPAATFTQSGTSGEIIITPGTAVLTVKGTVCGQVQ